jgi:hydrogenase expression/formation protein HypC
MCLGIPARVTRIDETPSGVTMGRVDFGGVSREVCLACVPDVKIGEYVVVHVGFAISRIDEDEALKSLEILRAMSEVDERGRPVDAPAEGGEDAGP